MPWTPPETPDPFAILQSAVTDTRNGAHPDALAKFLWFHHNALRYQQALGGVRLSFALSYWLQLAAEYPPAEAAFLRTRDETEAAFDADPANFNLFHDLASMNGYIGEGLRTADMFGRVARQSHSAAESLYRVAEPFLIAAERYEECGPFLNPEQQLLSARESYQVLSSLEDRIPPGEDQPPKLARIIYMRNVSTLVALLVLNRRPEDAARVRVEALEVVSDDEFEEELDAAMTGQLPPPLPD
jgi:hypothetical protein